jgi:hypothetical protein
MSGMVAVLGIEIILLLMLNLLFNSKLAAISEPRILWHFSIVLVMSGKEILTLQS